MRRALLAVLLAASPAAGRGVVEEAESALWDDHADVRDACFLLARAGVAPAQLAAALEAESARPAYRRRVRRLLARLAACASPSSRARARRAAAPAAEASRRPSP